MLGDRRRAPTQRDHRHRRRRDHRHHYRRRRRRRHHPPRLRRRIERETLKNLKKYLRRKSVKTNVGK